MLGRAAAARPERPTGVVCKPPFEVAFSIFAISVCRQARRRSAFANVTVCNVGVDSCVHLRFFRFFTEVRSTVVVSTFRHERPGWYRNVTFVSYFVSVSAAGSSGGSFLPQAGHSPWRCLGCLQTPARAVRQRSRPSPKGRFRSRHPQRPHVSCLGQVTRFALRLGPLTT